MRREALYNAAAQSTRRGLYWHWNFITVQEFGGIAFPAIVLREEDLTILAFQESVTQPLR
jgi:hypothetical protein